MAQVVKRRYRSDVRAAQARSTRRAIVEAAGRLFVENGFAATTIDAVADAAGVSRKTVFTAVGGKTELLKLAIDWAVAGDDEPVALVDRPAERTLLSMTDPTLLVRTWVSRLVEIDARAASLAHTLEVAADSDAAARALQDQLRDQRHEGARLVVKRLTGLGALRNGLSSKDAIDIAWLHGDPALFDRLVRSRKWPISRFRKWLSDSLIRQLTD